VKLLITLLQEPEDTDGKWLRETLDEMMKQEGFEGSPDKMSLTGGYSGISLTIEKIVIVPEGIGTELEHLLDVLDTMPASTPRHRRESE
jgi:hypothetical protein